MPQLNKSIMRWWAIYEKHVQDVVLNNKADCPEEVSYWRNAVFCKILTYLTPLSLIALVPSVIMSYISRILIIGVADLFAFFIVVVITISPGIKIETRKATFIVILFCLSVTLLYYLPLPAPGLIFALAVTILCSLIYSSKASYISAWANTLVCAFFALFIYFNPASAIASVYSLGSWIAISSNLILLSFTFSKCLDLLLAGLSTSLKENKISKAKLERANRLYQFISQINQTIVHVKDADTLFRKSCDIALEFGKYQMAWIGGFDVIENKIVLLNSTGIPEKDIKTFTDLPYEIDSPEDYVLRTGTHYLCNTKEHTLKIKRWKQFVKKHNIGSFIVLPIKKLGITTGTFNLYATEVGYFDQDDIRLLEEITSDISFALDLFEKADRHNQAELELQKKFAELEEVSNQQSAILNTLPASIALLDNKGNILKVNDEWIQFGKENGMADTFEHIGKNYIEVAEKSLGNGEKDGKRMALGLKKLLIGAITHFSMEYACDAPYSKRWYKAEVRPFKSHNQTGAVVMHGNITERKKAEAEMLLLINNTEESFILLNSDLQIVSFNNQFKNLYEKYFGVTVNKGDSILDYVQPERKEIASSIYKKVLAGNVEESEIIVPGPNNTNTYFSLKYSPAKDESGAIFGAFVTAIDISEKKKAEAQKEFEQRDKEALINSTDDLIWSISNDLKLIAANNAFVEEMKEFTGVEIKAGDDFMNFDSIPDTSLKDWTGHYARAFSGESFKSEIYNPKSAGNDESWLEASFSPIIVNGQIAGIACYSRDITERKLAELERAKITSDLLQRNRDLEQFTFIISHNLRAPTANIIGLTDYLMNETVTPEEQKDFLQGLASSALGLDTIIKDINNILQVKREVNEKKELISFSKLVNDILISFGNLNEKHQARIETDFSAVDEIFSLKVYLQSIFYNLISNSVKYRKPDVLPLIKIKSTKENGKIILTFTDNGLGIDLKAKGDKLFGLYARFHTHVEGKGMGLFMVKTQVEALEGKITAASEVDKGTEFSIVFEN